VATTRATMDFFAAQAAAKRKTAILVVWFALAWAGTVAIVLLLLELFLGSGLLGRAATGTWAVTGYSRTVALSPGALLAAAAAGVTAVTLGGSAWHWARLARDGPHAVARMVGGVLVPRDTHDAAERRLVNVVEEMAIASGVPVPAIYVLPGERGINAFAAGFTPDRAVIAVTQGAVEALTRDEMQGVVAHEFSHLLNADARLNLRLVALIGGITVLAFIGRTLVRGLRRVEEGARARRMLRGGGRFRSSATLVGLALWAAGSIGAFFGRLIRAAVSRQREFLADAAAVQFTRNPEGLARALAKIALQGSALASAAAPEVSHFFFASGLRSGWLATHPPIEERIRRIAPQGVAWRARGAVAGDVGPAGEGAPLAAGTASALANHAAAQGVSATVGNPEAHHVAYASELLGRLPAEIAAAARSAPGARALACALLADPDPAARDAQLACLPDAAVRGEVARLAAALGPARREDRMALLDLALAALDTLPRAEADALVRDLGALASARRRAGVFEWAVQRIVRRRIAAALGEPRPARVEARSLEDVEVEALELLSTVAWLGAPDEAGAQAAVEAGAAALGRRGWRPLPRDRVRASRLDAALARLDGAAPGLKRRLLDACAACALADGRVVAAEEEVVRAVAASLGLPVPPLAAATSARAAGAA
jgi:Zn-dependent protease with chaperone function